jgi:hypothetical protein
MEQQRKKNSARHSRSKLNFFKARGAREEELTAIIATFRLELDNKSRNLEQATTQQQELQYHAKVISILIQFLAHIYEQKKQNDHEKLQARIQSNAQELMNIKSKLDKEQEARRVLEEDNNKVREKLILANSDLQVSA